MTDQDRKIEIVYLHQMSGWFATSVVPRHTRAGVSSQLEGPEVALRNLLEDMGGWVPTSMKAEDLKFESWGVGADGWEFALIHTPSGLVQRRSTEHGKKWKSQLEAKADAVRELEERVAQWRSAG